MSTATYKRFVLADGKLWMADFDRHHDRNLRNAAGVPPRDSNVKESLTLRLRCQPGVNARCLGARRFVRRGGAEQSRGTGSVPRLLDVTQPPGQPP